MSTSQDHAGRASVATGFERLLRAWLVLVALAMLADAGVQFFGLRNGLDIRLLMGSRMLLLGLILLTHLTVFISPKMPRRPSLLLIFGGYWVVGAGFPLPLLDIDHAAPIVMGVEIGIGLAALGLLAIPGGSPSAMELAQRPWTSGWNSMGILFLSLILGPILLFGCAVDGLSWGINDYSKGYMRLRPQGLVLQERRYIRGTDEVWLIGMMHIADSSFYQNLFPARGDKPPTIVLLEGVTDRNKKLAGGFSMDNLARLLGLSSQSAASIQLGGDKEAETDADGAEEKAMLVDGQIIHWRNGTSVKRADIDIGEFRPETLTYLGALGQVFSSPSLLAMFHRLREPQSPLRNEAYQKLTFEDILDKRNAHLMGEIEASFPAYDRIIVPWGALHLPAIQEWLEKNGFKETGVYERVAVPFSRPKHPQ